MVHVEYEKQRCKKCEMEVVNHDNQCQGGHHQNVSLLLPNP